MSDETEFTGYLIEEEDRDFLRSQGPIPFSLRSAFDAPEEIDPRVWHRIENQGNQGSCVGHGLSSVVEYCYRIKTGQVTQYSRQGAYILSQRASGISGDRGATISGAVKTSEETGLPPETVWPYPNPVRYDNRIPPGALEAAAENKIRSSAWLDSYDDILSYISSGVGGVLIGIIWDSYCRNCTGILENYNGSGRGGHAVCFLGYSKRKASDGRKYLWLANSHSTRWGASGWAEVAPKAVDSMCRHRYWSGAGLSDLSVEELKPRKFHHTTENMGF